VASADVWLRARRPGCTGSARAKKMKTMNDLECCPQHIVIPRHFRRNGSCRCDDPKHHEMEGWGYTWNGKRWMVPEDAWEDCEALGG
jgi:hypothetical protein